MGSISKRDKLSEEQYEDRISNLPKSLIAQILSRLPTKYAVSTSVISTRWKELWTSITSFDIDDELLLCPQNKSTDPAMQRSFTSFVHRVLLHHVSCVQRFRLKCSQLVFDASLVNRWIADILLGNVRELDLDVSVRMPYVVLPEEFFTCRTLVVLKLKAYGDMNPVPFSVSLPSLRILHLSRIVFVNDDAINKFLLGCPVLEELSMVACVGENVNVNINAPMLTSLSMVDCLYRSIETEDEFERKIVLNTPALLYLTIQDFGENGSFLVENSHHLIRADIDLYASRYSDISEALTDLLNLKGLSDVQILKLGFSIAVDLRDIQLPKFLNMTYLELGDFHREWKFLLELLKNSPHLETLIFNNGLGYDFEDTPFLQNLARNVPSCLLYQLKVIEICDFNGDWKFVDYLLQNSKVLEKVNIDYGDGGSKWTINASRS